MLTLAAPDVEHMKRDWPNSSGAFFRKMLQQTKNLLHDHFVTLTKKERRFTIAKWSNNKADQTRQRTDENMSKVFRMYRIKQIQSNSKQYSTIDWTDPVTLSRNDISNKLEDENQRKKGKKKEDDGFVTPYMHKQFIETYITREGAKEEKEKFQRVRR